MHHVECTASESDAVSGAAFGLDPGIDLCRGAYFVGDAHRRGAASNNAGSSAPGAAFGNSMGRSGASASASWATE